MQIMSYQYLTNLTVEVDNLRKFIETVPGKKWHYWTNPRGKQVQSYQQVYYKDLEQTEFVENIISQLPVDLELGPIVFLKYNPWATLKPHTDWSNKSAILIGISKNSNIFFWEDSNKTQVKYTHPIFANLEKTHSVENNSDQIRFLLKIPTIFSFNDIMKKVERLK